MSILASLVRAYDRLPDAPPFGYSSQNIYFCIVLDEAGSVLGKPTPWGIDERGRLIARRMNVPYFGGRSGTNAPPYFLWDNSAYVLGVSSKVGFDALSRFENFRRYHLDALHGTKDDGLRAMAAFLKDWHPDRFEQDAFPIEMLDRNIVFRLTTERSFLHERSASKHLWAEIFRPDTAGQGVCLVTGDISDIARLHPPIATFENPARIVSFDKDSDAFASYGHVQGENAPTSVMAAFAYTATLNRFLERGSGHRIQIGDASTVFWADAANMKIADEAEAWAAFMMGAPGSEEDTAAAREIGVKLARVRNGEQLRKVEPELAEGVRFCVLVLAPNAARISIRFYLEDDFGTLTNNYVAYMRDMEFLPWPQGKPPPSIARCVLRTAPARVEKNRVTFDRKQISPLFAGELLRAVLSGARFPSALLPLLLMRVRSDHVLDSVRIALIKCLIVREMRIEGRLPRTPDGKLKEDYLVRTDPNDPNEARRLGRLFAVIERAQLASLGDEVNATIKDKFLGAAAATPQQVFVGLIKNAQHHTKRLRNGHSDAKWLKDKDPEYRRKVGFALERDIGRLWGSFPDGVPAQHSNEEQGLFLVGYYQERYGGKADVLDTDEPEIDQDAVEGEETQ